MRLGVMGGTFDPPHNGHLAIADAARRELRLTRVLFVPARQPPHKLDMAISPLEARLAMLELAAQGQLDFDVSMVEVERAGPSYTVDTLREFRARDPEAELFFIMGADSLSGLPTWHKPQEIVKLCTLVVARRPGYVVDLEALEARVPGSREAVRFVSAPPLNISSSDIQARVKRGEPIDEWVPAAVAQYILENKLYL